ncbi:hypothetical protein U1Q18_032604 [Sarracenia purpurea var. burkii]
MDLPILGDDDPLAEGNITSPDKGFTNVVEGALTHPHLGVSSLNEEQIGDFETRVVVSDDRVLGSPFSPTMLDKVTPFFRASLNPMKHISPTKLSQVFLEEVNAELEQSEDTHDDEAKEDIELSDIELWTMKYDKDMADQRFNLLLEAKALS